MYRFNHSWEAGEMFAGFFEFSLEDGEVSLEPIVVAYNNSRAVESGEQGWWGWQDRFVFDLLLRNYVTGEEMPVGIDEIPPGYLGEYQLAWGFDWQIPSMPDIAIAELPQLIELLEEVSSLVDPRAGLENIETDRSWGI